MGLRGSHGKKRGQFRFCCDFRYLNAVSKKDAYPIPRIDESLSELGDAKFFTTLNLGYAFRQVPLRKKDRRICMKKTGFACELGLYHWKRIPFGLRNATATFQRLMAQRIKRELCEAPVLGMPTKMGMYHLETDASVVAISGILHQEQEWNGRTVLRPIAIAARC